MALFLIYGKNNTHADPEKDARGCYKIGDIVEILDDSKHDGDLVKNPVAPPFYLVRITGVTKEQAEKYMEPHAEPRPATMTWNRKRWEEAQATGQYEEFVSVPVEGAISDRTETITKLGTKTEWEENLKAEIPEPFYYTPSVTKEMQEVVVVKDGPPAIFDYVELTGVVSYVDLTGDVPTTIRRRLHNVEVSNIPSGIRNQLMADRYVSVSWSQVRNYIRNRMTNQTAGATP